MQITSEKFFLFIICLSFLSHSIFGMKRNHPTNDTTNSKEQRVANLSLKKRLTLIHRHFNINQRALISKYFRTKENSVYIMTLLQSFPKDILNNTLFLYLLLTNKTSQDLHTKIVQKYHLEKHDIFGSGCLELTSDKKYYISVEAENDYDYQQGQITFSDNNKPNQTILLWDAQSKKPEKIDSDYQAPFAYLKQRNQLLCFKAQKGEQKYSFVLYDIAAQKEFVIKTDISKPHWDLDLYENTFPIRINSLENYCVMRSDDSLFIINLNTLKTQDYTNNFHHFTFNNDGNVLMGLTTINNQSYFQVFALNNNHWKEVLVYKLPSNIGCSYFKCMRDNYILLFQSGRCERDGFLHIQLLQDEHAQYYVKTIDNSSGKDCIVRAANNDFFACWQGKDRENFRLVSYDGSLVMDKEQFSEWRSDFSQDGNYYVATSHKEVDYKNGHFFTIKNSELLLLSLDAKNKKAHVIKHDTTLKDFVEFNKHSSFFITYSCQECSLHRLNGEVYCQLSSPNMDPIEKNCDFKFSSDGNGVMIKNLKENYVFDSGKKEERLPSVHDIGFAEYFLLTGNVNDECKQELKKYSGELFHKYIQ